MTPDPPNGRRIYGEYEIETMIGKGSIGKVYLARHRRIGRRAAVKVIDPDQRFEDDQDRDEFYRRLQREAELCGSLQHPNIVTLYEAGYEGDVVSFLATEYVAGESLQSRLRRTRPLPLPEALSIAADILRGEPVRFVLAGEGQLSAALRDDIARRGLSSVEWLGVLTMDELRARTLAADVCLGVFGASGKAARVVPNKVYDALACGRPVVTADTAGIREALHDGEDALLVPAGDGASLAAALVRLLDEGERARLGAAALATYRRAFTPAAVAGTLLEGLAGA